jgi:hypothetical protein
MSMTCFGNNSGSPLLVIIAVVQSPLMASDAATSNRSQSNSGSLCVMPLSGVIFDTQNGQRALHALLPATIENV